MTSDAPDRIAITFAEVGVRIMGWFVAGAIVTESPAEGTPDGVQLPATFQSVETAPVHVRAVEPVPTVKVALSAEVNPVEVA